ncbi:MAG: protein phosphatase 2C domain-containing protein, partial [Bacteroidaceae bacterium]|nr:protein phosphatase 2C domain-containing protein [Bacteroidaceae bacterium]
QGFGTTLTALVIASGIIMAINCGDSRIYRVRNGILTQLTTDHSLERFIHNPADSHVITNAISSDGETFFDKIKLNGKILHGDIYLLCSDGLSDMLRDDQIEALVNQGRTAEELVDAACKMGGKDNISVCVVRISEN